MHFFQPDTWWTPPDLVLPVPVDPTGQRGPTPGEARGRRWRRTGQNMYVPSLMDPHSPEQRIADASAHLGRGGALTGWPALRLRGAQYVDGLERNGMPRPVPLLMGPHNGRRRRAGVTFLYDRMEPSTDVRGLPCMPVRRALFDEMRSRRRLFDAVVAIDMTMMAGLTTIDEMTEYVRGRARWAGVPLVREALGLADPHSASPPEVRLRLLWQVSMRLPRLLVNAGVFDRSGVFVGYPDLLDVEAGLVIEYDGADHLPEKRRSKDVDREGAFRDLGLEVVHVMAVDMRHPKKLADRLARARGRSRFAPEGGRGWTLDPTRPRYCPYSCSCRRRERSGQ